MTSRRSSGRVSVVASRLDRVWAAQYRAAPRNRVRPYVRLADLSADDLEFFERRDDVELTPEHYASDPIKRYVEVDDALMTLLGFYLAEGCGGPRAGLRFAIGPRQRALPARVRRAVLRVFGRIASLYTIRARIESCGSPIAWRRSPGVTSSGSAMLRP